MTENQSEPTQPNPDEVGRELLDDLLEKSVDQGVLSAERAEELRQEPDPAQAMITLNGEIVRNAMGGGVA